MAAGFVSEQGCGCSSGKVSLSESQLKRQLTENRTKMGESLFLQPMRATCYCANPRRTRFKKQWWCPPRSIFERDCDDYEGRGPDYDRDGILNEPNYRQVRNRKIVECGNGWTYVECGRWTWTHTCCLTSTAEPGCLDGIPGRAIECDEIRTPGGSGTIPTPAPPSDLPPESPRPVPDPRLPPRR